MPLKTYTTTVMNKEKLSELENIIRLANNFVNKYDAHAELLREIHAMSKPDKTKVISNASFIRSFSLIQTLQFSEWLGRHYVRLQGAWVKKGRDKTDSDNWKDTGELFGYWMENCR